MLTYTEYTSMKIGKINIKVSSTVLFPYNNQGLVKGIIRRSYVNRPIQGKLILTTYVVKYR